LEIQIKIIKLKNMTTYQVSYRDKGSSKSQTMDVKANTTDEAKRIVESRGKEVITAKIVYK
jgi:hypothetical protein